MTREGSIDIIYTEEVKWLVSRCVSRMNDIYSTDLGLLNSKFLSNIVELNELSEKIFLVGNSATRGNSDWVYNHELYENIYHLIEDHIKIFSVVNAKTHHRYHISDVRSFDYVLKSNLQIQYPNPYHVWRFAYRRYYESNCFHKFYLMDFSNYLKKHLNSVSIVTYYGSNALIFNDEIEG